MKNPISTLSEKIQKETGENIITRVTNKVGADHEPTIFAEVELPNGDIYKGSGKNKQEAKQKAASEALKNIKSYHY